MRCTLLVEMEMDETVDHIEAMLDQEQKNGTLLGDRAILRFSIREIMAAAGVRSYLDQMRSQLANLNAKIACLEQSNKDLREALEMFPKPMEEDQNGK